jgi:hypothetical protein
VEEPGTSNVSDTPPEGGGGGAAGASSGASSPESPQLPEDEPPEQSGEIEIPLGVPAGPEEYSRLKRAARHHDEKPDDAAPEEAESDPGSVDPVSEDESEEFGDG